MRERVMQKWSKFTPMRLKLSDKILKYLVAAILLVVPLFPKFPLLSIPGSAVAFRGEDLLLFAAFIVWAIGARPHLRTWWQIRLIRLIVIFLAVGLVSLVSGVVITKTVVPLVGLLHWLRRIEYFIPLLLGYQVLSKDKKALGYYLGLLVLVVFIAFGYGLGQRYLEWPIITTQNIEYSKGIALRWTPGSHLSSTFAGHYDLATFIVLFTPFLVTGFFVLKDKKWKILFALAFLASLWLLTATIARLSVVAFIVAVTLALVLVKKVKAIPLVIVISMLFFASSKDLMGRYLRIFDVIWDKATTTVNRVVDNAISVYASTGQVLAVEEDRSSSIRFNVEWPRALRAFSKNPLLGTGFSSITLATDNDYLRLLGEVGLLGFASFGAIIVHILTNFIRKLPLRRSFDGLELAFIGGFGGSLIGLLLNATFIDIFEASKFAILFWLLTGFTLRILTSND